MYRKGAEVAEKRFEVVVGFLCVFSEPSVSLCRIPLRGRLKMVGLLTRGEGGAIIQTWHRRRPGSSSRAARHPRLPSAARGGSRTPTSSSWPRSIARHRVGTTSRRTPPSQSRRVRVSIDSSEFHAGSIVWAIVRDPRGYRKRRPAIILTPDAEISADRDHRKKHAA